AVGACLPATSVQWGNPKTAAFNTASTWIADFGTSNSWSEASTHPRQVVDVNGDGLPDIVGFGPNGVMVSLNTGSGFAASASWIAQFGTAQGWANNNTHPRQVVDINGDGLPDIVGFGSGGVMVSLNTGTAFAPHTNWIAQFGVSAGGWSDNNTVPRQIVDVNGDGLPDIVGFGGSGVMVALNTGTAFSTGTFWNTQYFGSAASAGTWDSNNLYPRYVADMNGDGLPDVVGFSSTGVMVAINNGSAFVNASNWLANFGTSAGGWSDNNLYPRYVVDVNGDGLPDIVGFSSTGVMVSINTGTSLTTATNWRADFGTSAGGWTDNNVQPRQLVDVNGDGLPDIVGFGPNGVMVSLNTGGTTFAAATSWISGFGTAAGWTNNTTHPRQLVDVTGDGIPDVLGFFSSGVSVASNQQDILSNYLISLGNGLGASTSVSYGALTQGNTYTKDSGSTAASFPQIDIKAPMYVTSALQSSNGIGGSSTISYTYGGLKVEVGTGRGMLGFRWVKQKDEGTGVESYSEFRQDFPYIGMPARSEQRLSSALNGGLLKRSTSLLECKIPANGSACVIPVRCDLSANATACVNATNARYFRYVASTTDEAWDINGAVYPANKLTTDYGVDATDGKFYGDPSVVSMGTSDGSLKSSANEYWPADTANWILGRLKKTTVTSTTATVAGSGTAADPYQLPTITASQSPSSWVATLPGTISWTSTNASLVSYSCTSAGAGYKSAETVWPNGSTPSQIASEAWVGIPTTCVFTATGPGGTASYNLTVNTLPAPRVPVTVNVGTQANYLANTAKAAGYIAGRTDITFNITGVVGSTSTGQAAFVVDNSWAPGDTVNIVVNAGAGIYGAGGAGGIGVWVGDEAPRSSSPGQSGGPALWVQRAASITNNGSIAGGGGGGGGGGTGMRQSVSSGAAMMYVSGGNGGNGQGAGASGLYAATGGAAGYHGSLYGSPWDGGDGGSGGNVGNAGGGGGTGTNGYYYPGSGGGSSGASVVGNAFITWIVPGTRLPAP
ncbi:hypothetical protein CHU94_00040, partial [Rhodoferax sp. TH121]|uniref:FG-GAP-like repeat-containing protein n=1 Tax=Rhodoferax sp. TH121 TaxID=2022803 RepID=UPI000BDC18F1